MPCAKAIDAYRPANGGPLIFKPPTNGRAYTPIQVPCGTCILCREEYARQQAIRITHEATQWETNSFVTLTYADEHLPLHNSLDYRDLVKFWKRLRKIHGSLRYYAVGEYGDKTNRPHYHACLFGHAFTEDRIILRQTPNMLWTSPTLEQAWGLGNVSVGELNFATARYTASYVVKKLRRKQRYVRIDGQTGELLALVQPRAFMSRNLAKEWWTKWHQGVEDHDHVVIEGRPQKPPKAYDKWLGETKPARLEKTKKERKEKAKKQTAAQSHARAENAHARVRQQKKTV